MTSTQISQVYTSARTAAETFCRTHGRAMTPEDAEVLWRREKLDFEGAKEVWTWQVVTESQRIMEADDV